MLSRTYAQAIAGTPLTMSFMPENGTFVLEFEMSGTTAPTEIYLNRALHYPNGCNVKVMPPGCLVPSWDGPNHLKLSPVVNVGCEGRFRQVKVVRVSAGESTATFV